jgi:hypothetical protein
MTTNTHNAETVKAVALAIKRAQSLYGNGWTEQSKAALSALPPQEVSVTVNPLEWWQPRKDNNYTHGAKTIFGTYYVGICGGRHSAHAEFFHETGAIEQFLGPDRGALEEAKMDAIKHHQGRILSAVTLQEVSVQEAARVLANDVGFLMQLGEWLNDNGGKRWGKVWASHMVKRGLRALSEKPQ